MIEQTKPDLVVACYGMNDGIYYPYSDDRFRKYQDGIIALREKVTKAGAKIMHLTPPVFDSVPIRSRTLPAGLDEYRQPYEGYDDVLNLYAAWLLAQRGNGWNVVDVHGPMKQYLNAQRERDPEFRLASDGIHPSPTGHWLITRSILLHWGTPAADLVGINSGEQAIAALPQGADLLKLVQRKQRVLKSAWLTATGHKRPGVAKGLPLDEAQEQARGIEAEIEKLLVEKTP